MDKDFSENILKIKQYFLLDTNQVVNEIRNIKSEIEEGSAGIGGYVVHSVIFSLYVFCKNPFMFVDNVCEAISVGGDSDSNASMVGNLCGALNPISIPTNFLQQINDKNSCRVDEIISLCKSAAKFIK